MRYLALLRGINVDGHRPLPMADLRRLCANLGYADVQTHIQSGKGPSGHNISMALENRLSS